MAQFIFTWDLEFVLKIMKTAWPKFEHDERLFYIVARVILSFPFTTRVSKEIYVQFQLKSHSFSFDLLK